MSVTRFQRFPQLFKQYINYSSCAFYSTHNNYKSIKHFFKTPKSTFDCTKTHVFKKYKKLVDDQTISCSARWKQIRSELRTSKPQNRRGINTDLILMTCIKTQQNGTASDKLKNGLNLIEAIEELETNPGVLVYVDLIDLYCQKANSEPLTQEDLTGLLKICNYILETTRGILTKEICISIIEGLCKTPEWRRCLELIKSCGEVDTKAYNIIIKKALQENNPDIAWKYLPLAILREDRKRLHPSIFLDYWNYCRRLTDRLSIRKSIENFLNFIVKNMIEMPEDAARELACFIKESKIGTSEFFAFNSLDKCYVCDNHFPCVSITQKQHETLTNAVKNYVVFGKSIFAKTTPKEWEDFTNLVKRTAPYDFVIDGLNIGLMSVIHNIPMHYSLRAQQLAAVVQHLVQQGKRILVIGRKHMNSWSMKHMHYVRNNATCFFLDNISEDDPFLLYGALLSGPQTHILSRDFMRTHSSLLNGNLKTIFYQWQQQHQYFIEPIVDSSKINIYQAIKHDMLTHKVNDRWHIPFISDEEYADKLEHVFEMPMNWMCCNIEEDVG